ncbi:MAG: glycoside hydrolase family 16 protein [Alistipes sp.]|nr:glycoside hydrolase family 16 protein [Alistipes sp.]
MDKKLFSILAILALCAGSAGSLPAQNRPAPKEKYHKQFIENFSRPASRYFTPNLRSTGDDFRYFPATPSLSEKGSDIMLFRIDPADPAGAGRGPEIVSTRLSHFGTYSARLRVPDVRRVQPNVGAVVGYFTYLPHDNPDGLSEIDFEWLIADPELIYIGTWTGHRPLQRVGRIVNLAEGTILNTSYRRGDGPNLPLDGAQSLPATVPVVEGYDASARFHTYGFDWLPDRLTWWILHPETGERVVLWDYTGSTPEFSGIPSNPTLYRLNFWHTDNWPAETNPASVEPPLYPYALEIDWMSYTPRDGN